jgi:hypothetical protein
MKLSCQPVRTVDHESFNDAVIKSHKRSSEPRAVLDTQRARERGVAKHEHEVVPISAGPLAASVFLSLKRVPTSPILRARAAISGELL